MSTLWQVLNTLDGVESPAANSARGWNGFVAGKKANAASGKTSIAFLDQCFSRSKTHSWICVFVLLCKGQQAS